MQTAQVVVGRSPSDRRLDFWVANPTSKPIRLASEPACGCAQFARLPRVIEPFSMSLLAVEADRALLLRRPDRGTLLEIKCSSEGAQWSESVRVNAEL